MRTKKKTWIVYQTVDVSHPDGARRLQTTLNELEEQGLTFNLLTFNKHYPGEPSECLVQIIAKRKMK